MNDVVDIYPLSPTQEGILFHSTSPAGESLYIELTTFRMRGELDMEALSHAWRTVVDRHPVLRTAFVRDQLSSPRQVVLATADCPIEYRDLTGLAQGQRDAWIADELDRRRRDQFDLAEPPLMRLLVVQVPGEYLCVWTYHHLLLDGWSSALLLADVAAVLDQGFVARPEPPRYRDYIAWVRHRDQLADQELWTDYLAGYREPATLTLPRIRPGARPSGSFRTTEVAVSVERLKKLRQAAAAADTTLGGLVEAAWGLTVSRFSGRLDVVIGVTVSGRPAGLDRVDEMVGLLINTIPVRVVVEPGMPARRWLTEFSSARHRTVDHQASSLTDVQRWAGMAPGTALFDTVLNFENYPDGTMATLDEGRVRVFDVRYETRTRYPVTLVVRIGAGMTVRAVVDDAQFGAGEPEAVLEFFETVLDRFGGAAPETLVRDLLAVPPKTRGQLLAEWNGSAVDRTRSDTLLPDLIEESVATRPDCLAVVDERSALTYRELDGRVAGLVHRLAEQGVRPGGRVGICLGRSVDLVTAVLAIARLGAAFVPMDPSHPAERIRYVLGDTEPAAVIIDEEEPDGLVATGTITVDLSSEHRGAGGGGSVPRPAVTADDLAYVIYTSGSTGNPKGVAVTHGSLANLVASMARLPGCTAEDRFLSLTSLTFDPSLIELLVPLSVGGTVHIGGRSAAAGGRQLDRYVARHGITAVQATPSRFRLLLESGWRGEGELRLYSCGEPFPPDLVGVLAGRSRSVWNMYGPTEITVYASVEEMHGETECVTVGRPISNTFMYVLDDDGGLVPVGVAGELYIGGAGVARGYWRRPDLTEQRFLPDPFQGGASRMYRTGDRARYLPDGRVQILGRMDRQLKLRGYRVEPGEIEGMLSGLPPVGAAAVTAQGARLVAHVVPSSPENGASPEAIRGELSKILPKYMVPDLFVLHEKFPLTPTGKIDFLALGESSAPVESRPGAVGGDYTEMLIKYVKEVLNQPEVCSADDFFELGGDSLSAMQLFTRIQADLGVDLDVGMIFDYATIGELAGGIARETNF